MIALLESLLAPILTTLLGTLLQDLFSAFVAGVATNGASTPIV